VDRTVLSFKGLNQLYKTFQRKTDKPKEEILRLLQTFKCSRNPDIESFLHDPNKALEFELRNRSRTYLWLYPKEKQLLVAGYFTLALDVVELPETLSKSLKKKLSKGYTEKPFLPAYLIGQLGRSEDTPKELLPGELILKKALEIIEKANSLVGNRLVIVDVALNKEKDCEGLVTWYKSFGFKELDLIPAGDKKLLRLYLILK